MTLRLQCALLSGALLMLACGCGSPGAPQPPSLKLPDPPTDLTASRAGSTVTLHWTMPRRATDRVLLSGDQRAVICRSLDASPCVQAGQVVLQPAVEGAFSDALPPALRTGDPHLLTYTVLLQNLRHQSAGASNAAYAASGEAPPSIDGLSAEATAKGILLRWQAASQRLPSGQSSFPETRLLRLHRTRVLAPGESANPGKEESRAGVPQPLDQTLELAEPSAPGPAPGPAAGPTPEPTPGPTPGPVLTLWTLDHALDQGAALNRTYRYTVERIARLTLNGHPLELISAAGAPATVNARDLFAPAVPSGLQAVADATSGAIDLSWSPDAEADLAGYAVYRRIAGGSAPPQRVSGSALLVDPAWRDAAAAPGIRYAYSVSAVDANGNESARSVEAEESVTPVPR